MLFSIINNFHLLSPYTVTCLRYKKKLAEAGGMWSCLLQTKFTKITSHYLVAACGNLLKLREY